MKTTTTTYRLETSIPGIKSWGWLPEHGEMTHERLKEVVARCRNYPSTKMRVTETTITTRRVNLKSL